MKSSSKNSAMPNQAERLRAYLLFAILLIAAWLLWSGMYKPLLLGLGAFSVILSGYIAVRMGYFDSNVFALRFNFRLFSYWAWLMKEVVKSSLDVTRVVLSPEIQLSTQLIEIDASHLSPVDQVILANSITLTPGSLTVSASDGVLLVHALTAESAKALEDGEMLRRVTAIHKD